MNETDENWLLQQLIGTAELLGQQLSPIAAAMLAEDLGCYSRQVLERALARVRTEHTGRLTPKAILDRIDEAMGRPAAVEAWAIASQALDERATVVWTGEMADAWNVALPVAATGDMIGARFAFVAAYERLVRAAREERRLPEVTVSIGWDAALRDAAIDKAVQLGYLAPAVAAKHKGPQLAAPVFNPVALLAGRVEETKAAGPDVRRRLAELREELATREVRRQRAAEERSAIEQQQLKDRKAAVAAAVQAHMEGAAP